MSAIQQPLGWCPHPGCRIHHDASEAEAARDRALDQVEANAEPEWMDVVLGVILNVAQHNSEFTTDEVWAHTSLVTSNKPHEPRAMGAAMRKAQAHGWIAPTNRTQKSTRPRCHARPVRVWVSALFPLPRRSRPW